MQIIGADFTSAPSRRKPMTAAVCRLAGDELSVERVERLVDLADFDGLLSRPGPWHAGFDFPFGQPRALVRNLGWPSETWAGYVEIVSRMDKATFEATISGYCGARALGDRHHLRATDARADSRSPLMLYGVPIAKMFFRGAPRLLKSGVRVLPCHRIGDTRTAVEAYPALIARRWAGGAYKGDTRGQQTSEHATARRALVAALGSRELRRVYGVSLELQGVDPDDLVRDATGDTLDAVLCAVQAAWSYKERDAGYGIPADADALEGWIVDPSTLEAAVTRPRRARSRGG